MEAFLSQNPYFNAGAGILGLTALSGFALQGLKRGAFIVKRRLLVSLEIPIKDQSYPWILEWMSTRNNVPKLTLLGRILSPKLHQLSVETKISRAPNGSIYADFSLVPGQGKHFLEWKGAIFQVERNRSAANQGVSLAPSAGTTPWETITITTLSRDRNLLSDMLEEAKHQALKNQEGKLQVFTSYGPDWRPFGSPRKKRDLNSVVLDGHLSNRILADINQFLSSASWYHDRGIPYRRGYLLHGPPGTGKSSFIQALAGHLEYNICIMNLAETGMTDDRFAHLLINTPPRSIILLEDIDAGIGTGIQRPTSGFQSNTLTLSGLLNGLDGVVASDERIVFMTTNHLERLDPALVRPGRVDSVNYLGNLSEEQSRAMFIKFFGSGNVDAFQEKMKDLGLFGVASPAFLQGHFVAFRGNSGKDCIEHLAKIKA
jgi:mitochondrial chaperone BCS1